MPRLIQSKFPSLIFAALLFCASSAASQQPAGAWTSVKSANFHVIGDAPASDIRETAARLDQFRQVLGQILPGMKLDKGVPIRVIVFRDEAAYRAFKPKRTDGSPDDQVAGYYLAGEDVDHITFVPGPPGRENRFATVFHEYVHLVVNSNFDIAKLPPWLNEGIAEYFETLRVVDQGGRFSVGAVPNNHLRLLRRTGLLPSAELYGATRSDVHRSPAESREAFYAQSWAVIHLLLGTNRLALNDLKTKIAELAEQTKTSEGLKNQIFGIEFAALDNELGRYINSRVLPVSMPRPDARLIDGPALTIAAVTEAEANAFLGDLLLHGGELTAAESYLVRALAVSPHLLLANESLGITLVRQKRTAEALKFLEKAIAAGTLNHLVHFGYAYALSRGDSTADNRVSEFTPENAGNMRAALGRAIRLAPGFAESYRLLAFINFVNGENLSEAVAMIRKGIELKPGDAEFELLLARILLRQEKFAEARQIAAKLIAAETPVRAEAGEILRALQEYEKAAPLAPMEISITMNRLPQIVFLKRSWLTESDLARVEKERIINNLNRLMLRPAQDELQAVGRISAIACTDDEIKYRIVTDTDQFELASKKFDDVRMAVLIEGERSFQLDCGVSLDRQLVALNYRPIDQRRPGGIKGQLTAITFVPDNFRLKSPDELRAGRTIVVEDDTMKKSGGVIERAGPDDVNSSMAFTSISRNLRKPAKEEERITAAVEKFECSQSGVIVTLLSSGRTLRLSASSFGDIRLGLYTVASTQLPLACGTGPFTANAVVTYSRKNGSSGVDGEIKAIEFVPEGFVL